MKKNETKYYIAYGSNLNKHQMRFRCPDARPVGISFLENSELVFKNRRYNAVATVEPKEGSYVPVAIWEITKNDEISLDRYEGFPYLYYKEYIPIKLNGKDITAMIYLMTEGKKYGTPSVAYIDTILEGYMDFNLNARVITKALLEANKKVRFKL